MRTETACQMRCFLKRKWDSHSSLKEHPFVSCIILTGRVLCKVTPAMPTWGLSPDTPQPHTCSSTMSSTPTSSHRTRDPAPSRS